MFFFSSTSWVDIILVLAIFPQQSQINCTSATRSLHSRIFNGKKLFSFFCGLIFGNQVFDVFSHCSVGFSSSFFDFFMNFIGNGYAFVSFSGQTEITPLPFSNVTNTGNIMKSLHILKKLLLLKLTRQN